MLRCRTWVVLWVVLGGLGLVAQARMDPADAARLAVMDAHALAAPPEAAASVATLAVYLAQPARTEVEKTRVIYRWMAENIAYDTQGLFSGQVGDNSADAVLRSRRSVCAGYADLFTALARAMGLEAVAISGYAKGYGYAVGETVGDGAANHAWNAVKCDGQWRLLDPTWGAGHLNAQRDYVRQVNEHYFLTPPGELIYDHFPADPRWQLLDPPVTRETFLGFARLRPAFFLNGLQLDSHPNGLIAVHDRLRLTLRAAPGVAVTADVCRDEQSLGLPLTLAQRDGDRYVIDAVFPRAGRYTLRLFAAAAGVATLDWALDYRVEVDAGDAAWPGFPTVYGKFHAAGARVAAPLARVLAAGRAEPFDLTVPGALEVAVLCGTEWTPLTRQDDRFTGTAPIRAGAVNVAAKFPGRANYDILLQYTGQ